MRVYVATAFGNKGEASQVMDALRDKGHIITYDWANDEADVFKIEDEMERFRMSREAAEKDFQAIKDCEALVVLDHPECVSTYTEMGMALSLNKKVVIVKNGASRNLFYNLPQITIVRTVQELVGLFNKS